MRLVISLLALSVLGALAIGCNSAESKKIGSPLTTSAPGSAPTVAPAPNDGVRRVTVPELKELLAKNEAIVIDVRNQASYDVAHIKGARLIPEAEVGDHSDELPRNKLIVTYCS